MILIGDMTHSGHISEYELLKEATNSYKIPVTFMFGNHDNRSNFTKVFPDVSLTSEGHLTKKNSFR